MHYLSKRLMAPADLPNAVAIQYTVPAGQRCILKKVVFVNHTAIARAVTVHLVPSGGAVANANKIWDARSLPPNTVSEHVRECFDLENITMEAGDTLQCFADAASAVAMHASGIEFTS